jgi:hypothetical protein
LTLPGPIPLNIQQAGNTAILSWTNPVFWLQAAPTLAGAFTNIPNASSPWTNTVADSTRFFRLSGP